MSTKSLEELEKLFAESSKEDVPLIPADCVFLTYPMRIFGVCQTLVVSTVPITYFEWAGAPQFVLNMFIVAGIVYGLACLIKFVFGEELHQAQDPFTILRRWHRRNVRERLKPTSKDISSRYQTLLQRVKELVERFKADSLGQNSPIGKARTDLKSMTSMINETKGRCFVYTATGHPLAEELQREIQQTEEFLAKVSTAVEAEAKCIEAFCGALEVSLTDLSCDMRIERDILNLRHARDSLRKIDAITITESRNIQSLFLARLSTMALILRSATDHAITSFPNSTQEPDMLLRAAHYVRLEEPTRTAFAELTDRLSEAHELSLTPTLET